MEATIDLDSVIDGLRANFGPSGLERVEECLQILVGKRRAVESNSAQEATRLYFPGLRARPFHDPAEFPWVQDVESRWEPALQELETLLSNRVPFSPYEDPQTKELGWRGWDTFPFYSKGRRFPRSAARCPQTAALLERIPHGIRQAMFSKLNPGAHIPPHTGGANTVLTCHLGLIVPEHCGLRVDGETRAWQPGKCQIFDDSFIHEAWNHSSSIRVVLLWDIWHPDLTALEIRVLTYLTREFARWFAPEA
jgi:aspartyl/asparaginyl beta-hydroxylase (cupin superfamily)